MSGPSACHLGGIVGEYLRAVTERWLLIAPESNPGMLEALDDRDIRPYRDMVAWAGEFPGKHLTAAVQVWRATGDPKLETFLKRFVPMLLRRQDLDGYLGVWPKNARLTNHSPSHPARDGQTWDTWAHYHIMLGLLLWHRSSGDRQALRAACRIGDLLCSKYLGEVSPRLVDTGEPEKNLAPVHALAMLYRRTRQDRYLALAEQIVGEFSATRNGKPVAGDFLRRGLAGQAFHEMPEPRWEALHSVMALAELYSATGRGSYRQAFERIWWSIVESDRHNSGAFSSGERATGDPYRPASVETCCTVAWIALSVEMLKLTGDSLVADELELSTLNAALAIHSRTGRWATYGLPSDGLRFASAHDIVFQARAGSPELNCCSVNSPRALGMISDWAALQSQNEIFLNYYGPSRIRVSLPDGASVSLLQETDYPLTGRIALTIECEQGAAFGLNLRIPAWSELTRIRLNGHRERVVGPGRYHCIRRKWKTGDRLVLDLDLSLHFWRGDNVCSALTSVYRGPVLLAYDVRYNRLLAPSRGTRPYGGSPRDPGVGLKTPMPRLDARHLKLRRVKWTDWLAPWMLFATRDERGRTVRLCDFASAGEAGTPYRSWLPLDHAPRRVLFSRANPLRSARLRPERG